MIRPFILTAGLLLAAITATLECQAFKIKFYGKGGIEVTDSEITAVCPEKSKVLCAVLHCKGLQGTIKCFKLVLFEKAPPAKGVDNNNGLLQRGRPATLVTFSEGRVTGTLKLQVSHDPPLLFSN
jgi:hypothetical protein